jgi:hypothetical protein
MTLMLVIALGPAELSALDVAAHHGREATILLGPNIQAGFEALNNAIFRRRRRSKAL